MPLFPLYCCLCMGLQHMFGSIAFSRYAGQRRDGGEHRRRIPILRMNQSILDTVRFSNGRNLDLNLYAAQFAVMVGFEAQVRLISNVVGLLVGPVLNSALDAGRGAVAATLFTRRRHSRRLCVRGVRRRLCASAYAVSGVRVCVRFHSSRSGSIRIGTVGFLGKRGWARVLHPAASRRSSDMGRVEPAVLS